MGNELLAIGDRAPEFSVTAINRDGELRLDDFVGRTPLFLNFMRGLHCPFCRRAMAQIQKADDQLKEIGVESAIIIITPLDRAQAYYRYRPTKIAVGTDPTVASYRAYGVPMIEFTESEDDWPQKASMNSIMNVPILGEGILETPMAIVPAMIMLNERDGYEETPEEETAHQVVPSPLDSRFMIDRDGIVRWVFVEAHHDPAKFGELPGTEQILEAARAAAA